MNMVCSVCKKNPAVVFINKIENGKTSVEGLCYNCAKEKGINPLQVLSQNANISDDDIEQISEQLGNFMEELSNNDGTEEYNDNPFAGIFNLFGNKKKDNDIEKNDKIDDTQNFIAQIYNKRNDLDDDQSKMAETKRIDLSEINEKMQKLDELKIEPDYKDFDEMYALTFGKSKKTESKTEETKVEESQNEYKVQSDE